MTETKSRMAMLKEPLLTATEMLMADAAHEAPTVLPKYRCPSYDIHDETYAKTLRNIEVNSVFNAFTQGLMDETRINRFAMLRAIDDYKAAGLQKVSPLSVQFEDTAFNCRPYQACVVS
jgi:hypothetical protein